MKSQPPLSVLVTRGFSLFYDVLDVYKRAQDEFLHLAIFDKGVTYSVVYNLFYNLCDGDIQLKEYAIGMFMNRYGKYEIVRHDNADLKPDILNIFTVQRVIREAIEDLEDKIERAMDR